MADNSHQSRSIIFDAATLLKKAGYECVRVAGSSRMFDLIAWKDGNLLFLVLKRSRSGISEFTDEVSHLVDLVRTSKVPGKVQFWIYRSPTWNRYQIMPGGALPFEGGAV